MYIKTFVTAAVISALPLNVASAGSVILGGDQACRPADTANVRQYLVSGGWIMGWLSAANRGNNADWLENVRPEHVVDLIDKYCRGDATVEQAGLTILGRLRMEFAMRAEWKRKTGKDAPQE
jgi:hypothetical protein